MVQSLPPLFFLTLATMRKGVNCGTSSLWSARMLDPIYVKPLRGTQTYAHSQWSGTLLSGYRGVLKEKTLCFGIASVYEWPFVRLSVKANRTESLDLLWQHVSSYAGLKQNQTQQTPYGNVGITLWWWTIIVRGERFFLLNTWKEMASHICCI